MDTQTPPAAADTTQLAVIQRKLFLDSRIRGGTNWFFWIAGLSLINTIAYLFGNSITFVVGLGVTQIIDGFMFALANELGNGGSVVRLIGFAVDVVIAGVFVLFGVLGRKRYRAPIIVGMVLYAMDGIILLLFKDFLSAGFHAFALVGIAGSLKSISELINWEKTGNSESIESLRQRMPPLQPHAAMQNEQTRGYGLRLLIIFGIVFLGFVTLVSAFSLIAVVISAFTVGARWTGDFWSDIFPFIFMLVITGIGLFGVFKLYRLLKNKSGIP